MSELVWIETPHTDFSRHSYERILQDILEYIKGEIVLANPPDNHLILRAPDLLWGEVHNPSQRLPKGIYKTALKLNRICQSHNISLVDGEGQEISVWLSECKISGLFITLLARLRINSNPSVFRTK